MVQPEKSPELPSIPTGIEEGGEEADPLKGDLLYEFFRAHDRAFESLGDELRSEGYEIISIEDDFMLIQITGKLPLAKEPFFFHGRRSTLSLSVGKSGTELQDSDREWVVWNKQKFLDKDGNAQDTFDLGDDEDGDEEYEPDAEVMDLMPTKVIDILRQLVSEYRLDTSVEGEFRIV